MAYPLSDLSLLLLFHPYLLDYPVIIYILPVLVIPPINFCVAIFVTFICVSSFLFNTRHSNPFIIAGLTKVL